MLPEISEYGFSKHLSNLWRDLVNFRFEKVSDVANAAKNLEMEHADYIASRPEYNRKRGRDDHYQASDRHGDIPIMANSAAAGFTLPEFPSWQTQQQQDLHYQKHYKHDLQSLTQLQPSNHTLVQLLQSYFLLHTHSNLAWNQQIP
nr:zinc finger, CCHC-type, retrotransposon Gag domain protein [Tanacetum cinerariifolium]